MELLAEERADAMTLGSSGPGASTRTLETGGAWGACSRDSPALPSPWGQATPPVTAEQEFGEPRACHHSRQQAHTATSPGL